MVAECLLSAWVSVSRLSLYCSSLVSCPYLLRSLPPFHAHALSLSVVLSVCVCCFGLSAVVLVVVLDGSGVGRRGGPADIGRWDPPLAQPDVGWCVHLRYISFDVKLFASSSSHLSPLAPPSPPVSFHPPSCSPSPSAPYLHPM